METTLGYIIIFGLVILFTALYFYRSEKQTLLPVSQQTYPELLITVLIKKEKRKITTLLLQIKPTRENLLINNITLELTDKNHDKKRLDLSAQFPDHLQQPLPSGKPIPFPLALSDLLALMEKAEFDFENFRLVAKTPEGKIFKTHPLTYHPRWGIFKSDSGKYN